MSVVQEKFNNYQNFIDGRFAKTSDSLIEVFNPATQELLGSVPDSSPTVVDEAIEAARRAQPAWEKLPTIERARHLRAIAERIRANVESLARIITQEQGKVLPLARVEVNFTADYIDYMAEWARRIEGEVIPSDSAGETIFLLRKAVGVVAGILPWNFPFFLIARKMAPALITGNTIVIKPSEETPLNAFAFAQLVAETELPSGVFNLVSGTGRKAGIALSSHRDINLVSFTGSMATGTKIMEAASKNLSRVNLELGGKAPAIVLADADLDLAAKAIYNSRIINTGQVCNCAERVYVHRDVADAFTDRVSEMMRSTRYGDPMAEQDLQMGPLVNQAGLQKVADMVKTARDEGAQVVTGGKPDDRGHSYHYEPTVLTNCRADMEIMRKEIFGPVLPIQTVDGIEEAITLANDSDYGLTSSLYTNDLNTALRTMRDLQYGETYINRENFEAMQGFHAGRRKSGIGGADGKHGLYEYTDTQVIYLRHG